MDRRTDRLKAQYIDRQTERLLDGWMDGWIHGYMDREQGKS